MKRNEQWSTCATPDRQVRTRVAADAARAVLAARLGETVLLVLEGRQYRLTVEVFFRLEEMDGAFVYYFRRAAALERRMQVLAPGSTLRIVDSANSAGRGQDN